MAQNLALQEGRRLERQQRARAQDDVGDAMARQLGEVVAEEPAGETGTEAERERSGVDGVEQGQ